MEVVMAAVATIATDLQAVAAEVVHGLEAVVVVVVAMGEAEVDTEVDTEVATVMAHPVEEVGVEAVAVEAVDGIDGL
jgi:hypothetical protein